MDGRPPILQRPFLLRLDRSCGRDVSHRILPHRPPTHDRKRPRWLARYPNARTAKFGLDKVYMRLVL